MFKDYSYELGKIEEHLLIVRERVAKVEELEKTLNGISDEINEIKEHLGLGRNIRCGLRHDIDIWREIDWWLKRDKYTNTDLILRNIEGFIFGGEIKYETKVTDENRHLLPASYEEEQRQYRELRREVLSEWRERIELRRSIFTEEEVSGDPSSEA